MIEDERLTREFEAHRSHLRAVAYRMLGSASEADDALQESWLRLHRADTGEVRNLGGWLTTVVARVCLTMLQSRRSRQDVLTEHVPEPAVAGDDAGPEQQAVLADSVGQALLVVLDSLTPAERLAFVLHDMFAVPFDEIAPIVERSPAATRQLASRARRRVRGASAPETDPAHRRDVVAAFLAAAREGDFEALLAVLDPDVVVRADDVAVRLGAAAELRGAETFVNAFAGKAKGARPALVDGLAGAAWAPDGQLKVAYDFTVADGRIVAIDLLGDVDSVEVELEV